MKLTANPDVDHEVDAWGGDCANDPPGPTCRVTMNAARSVSVTFKRRDKTLTIARPAGGRLSEGANLDCGSGAAETRAFSR